MPLAACSTMWEASAAVMRGPRAGSRAPDGCGVGPLDTGMSTPDPARRERWGRVAGVNPSGLSSSCRGCERAGAAELAAPDACVSSAAEVSGARSEDRHRNRDAGHARGVEGGFAQLTWQDRRAAAVSRRLHNRIDRCAL